MGKLVLASGGFKSADVVNGAATVSLGTLISGENQTTKRMMVETPLLYDEAAGAGTVVHSSTVGDRFFGFICTVANSGGITIYDNSAGSGQIIYTVASCAAGDGIRFPGGIVMTAGITSVLGTDGTIIVLYATDG